MLNAVEVTAVIDGVAHKLVDPVRIIFGDTKTSVDDLLEIGAGVDQIERMKESGQLASCQDECHVFGTLIGMWSKNFGHPN